MPTVSNALQLTQNTALKFSMFCVPCLLSLLAGSLLFASTAVCGQDQYDWPQVRATLGFRTEIVSLAYSPDGKRLSSLSADGKWRIWKVVLNATSLQERSFALKELGTPISPRREWIQMEPGRPTKTYWNKEGEVFALTDEEEDDQLPYSRSANVWHFDAPSPLVTFRYRHMTGPSTVDVSPSKDKVVVATGTFYHAGIQLFDLRQGILLRDFEDVDGGGTDSSDSPLFSPDGALVAAGYYNNKGQSFNDVGLWDSATGKRLRTFPDCLRPLGFSPDGRSLLVLKKECRSIECRNVAEGTLLSTMPLLGTETANVYRAKSRVQTVFLSNGQCVIFAPGHNPQIWNITKDLEYHQP